MARQNSAAAAAPTNPPPKPVDSSYNISNGQNNPAQQVPALNQLPFQLPLPVNVPAPSATFAPQTQGPSNGAQNYTSNIPFAGAPPVVPPTAFDPAVQQQLMLIKALSDQGFTPDRIAGVIAAMGQGLPVPGAGGLPPPPFAAQNQNAIAQNAWGVKSEESRDYNGFDEAVRSPQGRFRRRSRSRSPKQEWNARDSPGSRRRQEQNFDYDRASPGHHRGGEERGRAGRGGRGNDYRQRSPQRRGQSTTPPRSSNSAQKWIGHDATIARGSIKGIYIFNTLVNK